MSISLNFAQVAHATLARSFELESISTFNQNFQLAAAGDATAQGLVADSFYYGTGTVQDLQQAYRWYELAAENGNSTAREFLNICMDVVHFDQQHTTIKNWFH